MLRDGRAQRCPARAFSNDGGWSVPRIAVALGVVALLTAIACQRAPTSPASPTAPAATAALTPVPGPADVPLAPTDLRVPGTFIYSQDGNLWSMVVQSPAKRLTSFPTNSF